VLSLAKRLRPALGAINVRLGIGSSAKSETPTPCPKGRCPIEYKSWLYWEVGLPIASPVVLFLILWAVFTAANVTTAPAKALISISGSGDLLIFSALLLINAGAKFRILELPKRSKRDFEAGDLNPDTPFICAIIILLLYIGVRVALDIQEFANSPTIRFIYGIVSVVILVLVFLWIDGVVCVMHTKQLRHRLDSGLIESQYNV
jgi:hypothetical protein